MSKPDVPEDRTAQSGGDSGSVLERAARDLEKLRSSGSNRDEWLKEMIDRLRSFRREGKTVSFKTPAAPVKQLEEIMHLMECADIGVRALDDSPDKMELKASLAFVSEGLREVARELRKSYEDISLN